jgi:hypothetical protein
MTTERIRFSVMKRASQHTPVIYIWQIAYSNPFKCSLLTSKKGRRYRPRTEEFPIFRMAAMGRGCIKTQNQQQDIRKTLIYSRALVGIIRQSEKMSLN